MKKIIIIIAILSILILSSCTSDKDLIVGGDKDKYGCIGSAGYQWCPSTENCQRMWEEYCEEFADQYRGNESITDFEECIAAGNPAMESYPRQCSNGEQTFTEQLCDLFENIDTLELDCFGCAFSICKDPTKNWTVIERKSNQCKILDDECALKLVKK